ncbi:DUF5686 family protein [Capnocytophaga sp.]|uniref:DUF5686 family protein n=1 Tax=Capnocytophaga sp. TaxID=44737 RepID=UPI0026DD7FE2|nr:DUF5686 family protein [Capnocytophaga sp.]MDO5104667.1 DUF5686 family protein [Capnocytophaga sp.]
MKKYIYALLFWLPFLGFSQIKIEGKVIDEDGNPIAYANVIFPKTTKGTSTDLDGRFSLYSDKKQKVIEVSFIGYVTKSVHLKGEDLRNLVVVLTEGEELSEVVVVGKPKKALSKKENPAYRILQGIWKNKSKKGLQNADSYEYKKYTAVEMGLNNLDSVFLKETLGRDYDTVRKMLSEKKHKNTFSMPIYLKESVEKVYQNNKSNKTRTDVEMERSQGITQKGFGLERFSRAFDEFNIYDNSYLILNQAFVSPLSEFGYSTYHYVLNDTIRTDERNFYRVFFFPKTDEDLALEGHFVVDDKSFIVKSIEMRTTAKTNINMVRGMFFEKHFKIENDSVYVPEKEIQEGDFTLLTKNDYEKGLYIHNVIEYSDVLLNKPKSDLFYTEQTVLRSKGQSRKDSVHWLETRTESSESLLKTQALIEKIGGTPRIKAVTDAIDFIGSGYLSLTSYLQAGTYWQLYEANDVEKHRFRLGFRSFVTTEDRFRTYFYGAYGTRDKRFKYGLSASYLLTEYPRITLGAMYQNDYLQLGRNNAFKGESDMSFRTIANAVINRGDNYFLTEAQRVQAAITYDIHNNFKITFFGRHQRSKPADTEHFSIAYKDVDNQKVISEYTDFNSGISISYTPGRNVYGEGVEQRYGKKLFSTYAFKYTKAAKGVFNSAFDYDKVEILLSKPLPLWGLGILHTTIEAGKIFGNAPLTGLAPTPSNQSYSVGKNVFALLDYYDFVSDTYINGHFEHHFNGLIFNRIPWVKKLGLRSLVFARFTLGTISDKNKTLNATNLLYNAPEKPYWEYGFGIENIGLGNFRFVRIDFVWRSDFNDVNGVRNPKFGIRVGIAPTF